MFILPSFEVVDRARGRAAGSLSSFAGERTRGRSFSLKQDSFREAVVNYSRRSQDFFGEIAWRHYAIHSHHTLDFDEVRRPGYMKRRSTGDDDVLAGSDIPFAAHGVQ